MAPRVIVGYEESGKVTSRLRAMGINAWSVDILPTRGDHSTHIQDDIWHVLSKDPWWDAGIFFHPCTALCVSGNRTYAGTDERDLAVESVKALWSLPFPKMLENSRGVLSTRWRKPDQSLQPWHFGEKETKCLDLWFDRLPHLVPTNVVGPPPKQGDPARKSWERCFRMGPSPNRSRDRSETRDGIADAIASQIGEYLLGKMERVA